MVELIMLEARARVTVATRHGSERERLREIESAIARPGRGRANRPRSRRRLCTRRERDTTRRSGWPSLAAARPRRAAARVPTTCHDLTLGGDDALRRGRSRRRRGSLEAGASGEITSFWAWYVLGHCHFAPETLPRGGRRLRRVCSPRTEVCLGPLQPRPALAKAGRLHRRPGFLRPRARDRSAIHRGPGQPGAGRARTERARPRLEST